MNGCERTRRTSRDCTGDVPYTHLTDVTCIFATTCQLPKRSFATVSELGCRGNPVLRNPLRTNNRSHIGTELSLLPQGRSSQSRGRRAMPLCQWPHRRHLYLNSPGRAAAGGAVLNGIISVGVASSRRMTMNTSGMSCLHALANHAAGLCEDPWREQPATMPRVRSSKADEGITMMKASPVASIPSPVPAVTGPLEKPRGSSASRFNLPRAAAQPVVSEGGTAAAAAAAAAVAAAVAAAPVRDGPSVNIVQIVLVCAWPHLYSCLSSCVAARSWLQGLHRSGRRLGEVPSHVRAWRPRVWEGYAGAWGSRRRR